MTSRRYAESQCQLSVRRVWLEISSTAEAHQALHLLTSCWTYTPSTGEGSRESRQVKCVEGEREDRRLVTASAPRRFGCDANGATGAGVYLSRRRRWPSLLSPAAGIAGILSRRLWRPGAAAALRFLPAEARGGHFREANAPVGVSVGRRLATFA